MSHASLTRVEAGLLALALGVGAWLRFSTLSQGIPFALGVDEPEILERAVRMMKTGDFHPDFFDYPGLYIYLQCGVAVIRFMAGAMSGLWATLDQAPSAEFYLWGRAVTAAFGSATIALVFFIGRRLGVVAAATAALLLAVQPMHVRESHFILTDVPMTFFATLAILLTLRAYERATWRGYFAAGLAVGLAAATKYHGGSTLILPLLTLAMRRSSTAHLRNSIAAIVGGAALAFLAAAPYTILDLPAFLNKFGTLSHMYAVGPAAIEPGWLTYLKHLRINLGWPGVVLAFASILFAVERAWRAPAAERATWATLAAFVVLTFWLVAEQRLIYGRYMLPIIPPLAVLMGGAVARIVASARTRLVYRFSPAVLAGALLLALGAQPVAQSIGWLQFNRRTGTAELTYRWTLDFLPAGSKVAVESRGLLLPQDRFVSENFPQLIEWDLDWFRANGYHYLVASSQSFGRPLSGAAPDNQTRAYRALFDRLELLTTIVPSDEHPGEQWRVYRLPPG